ncbi:hypothetical protein [Bradyrhizobium sp. NAS80.1]|nr:hypothetical protein [Bradyrhizobium sp. NAS80.1]
MPQRVRDTRVDGVAIYLASLKIGYGVGLLLIVPLGDLVENRSGH